MPHMKQLPSRTVDDWLGKTDSAACVTQEVFEMWVGELRAQHEVLTRLSLMIPGQAPSDWTGVVKCVSVEASEIRDLLLRYRDQDERKTTLLRQIAQLVGGSQEVSSELDDLGEGGGTNLLKIVVQKLRDMDRLLGIHAEAKSALSVALARTGRITRLLNPAYVVLQSVLNTLSRRA